MGASYINAAFTYRILKKNIRSFEDYVVANFGRKLGEFNMLNYTEKIWGIPSNTIHPDWAKQRIKGLDLRSALKDALLKRKNKDSPKTLVDQFYYPKYGTGLIYETIAKKITQQRSDIQTNTFPTQIFHTNNRIQSVELNNNGKTSRIHPSTVVSSIPITEFITLLHPKPPKEVLEAAQYLKWRAQVYLFITLDKERVNTDNWIYVPESNIPIGRISEMKNFSEDMAPKGKTSLFLEFFVTEHDSIWNMNDREVFNLAMKHLKPLRFFSKEEIRNYYVFRKTHVYPVYDIEYQKHLKVVKTYLNLFTNLFYVGRPGRFQYTNQDHSLEMGILAAKSITENTKVNFDDIGSEHEYFEKGYVRSR